MKMMKAESPLPTACSAANPGSRGALGLLELLAEDLFRRADADLVNASIMIWHTRVVTTSDTVNQLQDGIP